jgi:uncharacterized membrane protein YdfJ with MMPL/SSD domain
MGMQRVQDLLGQMSNTAHHMFGDLNEVKATPDEMRDHLADFDDFVRPFRNYLHWEQYCYDIPVCSASRSVFEAIDGVDKFSDDMKALATDDAPVPTDHRRRAVYARELADHAQQFLGSGHAHVQDDRHG